MTDQPISEVGTNLITDLTNRIAALTAERQTYITNANMEINHQVGVYDGQIAGIQQVIEMLTSKPSANDNGIVDEKSAPDSKAENQA